MKNIEVICMGGCKVLIQNIFHYYSYPQRVGMNSVKCVRIYNCSLGQMEQILSLKKEENYGIVMYGFPYDSLVNWSIKEFGPFYIPAKGTRVKMNPINRILYKNAIEWEQKEKLLQRGDSFLLNDSIIQEYQFEEDYYFVAGDKVMNFRDSRYWGLLPEKFIVGKATLTWKSVDPMTDKIRWNRVFKMIE